MLLKTQLILLIKIKYTNILFISIIISIIIIIIEIIFLIIKYVIKV